MRLKAVLPENVRNVLAGRLPETVEGCWVPDGAAAIVAMEDADVAWLDLADLDRNVAVRRAQNLRWLFTYASGLDGLDLALLVNRNVLLTNGSGVNSSAVAEYAVLGMLAAAKPRLADHRDWPARPPGRLELKGTRGLIVGFGAIGKAIGDRLKGFNVAVTGVTRSGRGGTLRPDQWRPRVGEFDWVVLATPSTSETRSMIGPDELTEMKSTAWLINVGRGTLVDQQTLLAALRNRSIAGAFLDVVTPEPLPREDPLWKEENCLISMHLFGRSQTNLLARAADLFLEDLDALLGNAPMRNTVDLRAGY